MMYLVLSNKKYSYYYYFFCSEWATLLFCQAVTDVKLFVMTCGDVK